MLTQDNTEDKHKALLWTAPVGLVSCRRYCLEALPKGTGKQGNGNEERTQQQRHLVGWASAGLILQVVFAAQLPGSCGSMDPIG